MSSGLIYAHCLLHGQCALVLLHSANVLPMEDIFAQIYMHDNVADYIRCEANSNHTLTKQVRTLPRLMHTVVPL